MLRSQLFCCLVLIAIGCENGMACDLRCASSRIGTAEDSLLTSVQLFSSLCVLCKCDTAQQACSTERQVQTYAGMQRDTAAGSVASLCLPQSQSFCARTARCQCLLSLSCSRRDSAPTVTVSDQRSAWRHCLCYGCMRPQSSSSCTVYSSSLNWASHRSYTCQREQLSRQQTGNCMTQASAYRLRLDAF